MMKKRIFSRAMFLLLAAAMCFSLLPAVNIAAADPFVVEYTNNDTDLFGGVSFAYTNMADLAINSTQNQTIAITGSESLSKLISITINGETVALSKMATSTTWLPSVSGVTTAGGVGHSYSGGTLKVLFKKITVTTNVVISFNFETGAVPEKGLTVSTSSNGDVGKEFISNIEGAGKYILTATPTAYGYGFDHWEYSVDNGSTWAVDGEHTSPTATVTVTRNTVYKAVFAKSFFSLLGETAVIAPAEPDADFSGLGYTIAGHHMQVAFDGGSGAVREGEKALLLFQMRTLWSFVQNLDPVHGGHMNGDEITLPAAKDAYEISGLMPLQMRVYAGEGIGGECIWDYETYHSDGFWPKLNQDMWFTFYIPKMAYTDKVTVVFEVGPSESQYHAVTQKTYTLTGQLVQDTLKEQRWAALGALDDKMAVYNANREEYHLVRYLLLGAYSKAVKNIQAVPADASADALQAVIDAAFAQIKSFEDNKENPSVLSKLPGVSDIACSGGSGGV
jgi:hypothetical protein